MSEAETTSEAAPRKKRTYTKRAGTRPTATKRTTARKPPPSDDSPFDPDEGSRHLSDSFDDVPLRRRTRSERQEHRFDVPEHLKQRGMDYSWWPTAVLGQPVSRSDMTDIYHGGWRPVKADEMRPMMPPGDTSEFVEDGGQRLFKRPMAFTDEAKAEERALAEQQTGERIRAAARGQTRDGPGLDIPGVRTVPLGAELTAEAGTYKGARH